MSPARPGAARTRTRPRATVVRLALADLGHEWVLTLCLVLALGAVISPLLILLGLKHGTVETLRCGLVQDPVYRELRPARTRTYPPEWFAAWRGRPALAFLTPTILPASSIVGAARPGQAETRYLDLIPTGAADPLVLENGGVVPGAEEVVLTESAATALQARVGDALELRATRSRGGRPEQASAHVRVAAVLGPRAGTQARVYAPLDLVLDVETYKEGIRVPSRGWSGGNPTPYQSFDGVLVLAPAPLTPVQQAGLAVGTGLSRVAPLTDAALRARTRLSASRPLWGYDLAVADGSVQAASLRAIKEKLRGTRAAALPYVNAPPPAITLESGAALPVAGYSLGAEEAERLGLDPPPWGALNSDLDDPDRLLQVLLPAGTPDPGAHLNATASLGATGIPLPLRVAGTAPGAAALVPVELLGILRTAADRPVDFDPHERRFRLSRTGFQGFRMYASDIDAVAGLEQALAGEGIEVITQAPAIARIRILDRGLTRVFWLVALVGITGGFAALIASLYAAVQRKRHPLAVLRLLGLARRSIFRFPLYQGATIAAGAALLATLGYAALAVIINRVFAADLALISQTCRTAQRICSLPPLTLSAAALATLSAALMSALFAAGKATRIDPAEALREE